MNILLLKSRRKSFKLKMDNSLHFFFSKRIEYHNLIDSIDELRLESMSYGFHNFAFCILWITKNTFRAKVTGHNYDCISKINNPTLSISKSSVVQNLKKYIEYIRMCLLNFIK